MYKCSRYCDFVEEAAKSVTLQCRLNFVRQCVVLLYIDILLSRFFFIFHIEITALFLVEMLYLYYCLYHVSKLLARSGFISVM